MGSKKRIGLELNKLLLAIRKELDKYHEIIVKEKREPIAFLKEMTLTVHMINVTEAEGGVRIFVAKLGGKKELGKTHTIVLKFIVPEEIIKREIRARRRKSRGAKVVRFVGKIKKS